MVLEVVGQERAEGSLDDSLGEDLAELVREEGGRDVLGRVGIDGNGLELWVDASARSPLTMEYSRSNSFRER